jgi:hypothetical protein
MSEPTLDRAEILILIKIDLYGVGWSSDTSTEHLLRKNKLVKNKLLDYLGMDDRFGLTDKGRAYLAMLLATPLPVNRPVDNPWYDPRTEEMLWTDDEQSTV